MCDESQQAKVLLSDDDGNIESLWTIRVGNDLYRLDNIPWFAYSVSCEDVVEARALEEGGLPEFIRVVSKSGNRTVRLILEPPADQSEESRGILDRLVQLGCDYEGANRKYIGVNVPPGVDLPTVCDFLTSTGQKWEHADPTWNELHGDSSVS